MKTIICGSRHFDSEKEYWKLERAIAKCFYEITEVVSGGAKGVDYAGEVWAERNGIAIKLFPAQWNDLKHPLAKIKTNKQGYKYNSNAGPIRNSEMVAYSEICIALPRKDSKGTYDCINKALKAYGPKKVFVYEL